MSTQKKTLKQPELTFNKALGWLSSAVAFDWAVIVWVAFWPLLTGLLSGEIPGYELAFSIHLFDLLTGFFAAVVLLVARFAIRANSSIEYRANALRNLLIQSVAACAGTCGALLIAELSGPTPQRFVSGLPIGVFSLLGQIVSFTLVVAIIRELRLSVKLLAKKTHSLNHLGVTLEHRVLAQRAELQSQIQQRLAGEIGELQSSLAEIKSKANHDETALHLAEKIKHTIDQVVRPLSLEIANADGQSLNREMRSLRQIERSIRRLPLIERMRLELSLGYVFNLPFSAIALAVFVLPSYGYMFGPVGIIGVGVPATIVSLGAIWLARRWTMNVQSTYLIAILEILVGSAVTTVPFSVLNALVLGDRDIELQQVFLALVFSVCAFAFYSSLFVEVAYLNLERTRLANRETKRLLGILQNESQVNRRTVAQIVHGKIQARLQAASLRLKQSQGVTDELIAAVAADLDASTLDASNSETNAQNIQTQIKAIQEQWSGICEITIEVDPRATKIIDGQPFLKSAVIEAIREALNNAVKHGEADEADGSVTLNSRGQLVVQVRNTNYASNNTQVKDKSGYGSHLLDEITDRWSVEFDSGDAIFQAEINVPGASL